MESYTFITATTHSIKSKERWSIIVKFLSMKNILMEKSSIEEAIMGRQNLAKSMRKTPKRMGNSEARLHKRKTTQKQEKINNKINSLKTPS